MSNVDKNVEITVTPNPNPTGPKDRYLFSMDDGKGATQELAFDKTKDNMKKTDVYKVKFKLKNKDGADLRFSKDIAKVLWAKPVAQKTDPCPSSECYWDPIFYVDPNDPIKDFELTVTNTDPAKQLFKFAFNFLPPGKSDPLPNSEYEYYDPIGDNQNGGRSASFGGGSIAMAIGGAAIGATASLLMNAAATAQSVIMWTVAGAVIGYAASLLIGGRRTESPA